ncbi:hypothetical protein UZ38_24690 [Bacillus amyloliquefaciens]|nr:hypothetical protein D5285_02680 [Bacillus paralicheniformis]KJD54970.1 hypothetical protein UZ38_24690 [Bacillus amyloliquefaciens]KUL13636.1 hypothetical protein LI7559_06250 [Bacillus licheniformis LMG 7559]KUL16651.1 hypothetical protein LI6934_14490 [Bacillus licheniformis LMG 6934]OCI04798.1 hypothetical protein BBP22_11910 [Bacillus paralicheniformis]
MKRYPYHKTLLRNLQFELIDFLLKSSRSEETSAPADVSRLGCICAALFIHSVSAAPARLPNFSRFYLKLCFQMADHQFE